VDVDRLMTRQVRTCAPEDRLRDLRVEQAMTRALLACEPDTSLEEAERRMREHQVRRLLVIEGESRLVGIVSLADLARADGDAAERDPALSRAALGDTLRAVSQPSRPT